MDNPQGRASDPLDPRTEFRDALAALYEAGVASGRSDGVTKDRARQIFLNAYAEAEEMPEWAPIQLVRVAVGMIEAAAALRERAPTGEPPILSKYHGQRGFELERFIADYEAWRSLYRGAPPETLRAEPDQFFLAWKAVYDLCVELGMTRAHGTSLGDVKAFIRGARGAPERGTET